MVLPSTDRLLLRPLQILAAAQFEQGKLANARVTFRRMQTIITADNAERALVHGFNAALSHAEGRLDDAEKEYRQALQLWIDSGRGNTPDAADIVEGLSSLYMQQGRLGDASNAITVPR